MKPIKAILIIIVLGAMTPILWVLAPFHFEKEDKYDNSK